MSFANPTALRIGMTGNLSGRNYRVLGRVVLGMDDDGTTYYWNEFNLVDDSGEPATLAFEETEPGGIWKLFTMFEPEYPLTAADAATRRVGDELNLEGTQVRVTLVDESRVYHIEGEAPEGVEVGDTAHYFNAEAPDTMIVVSWTGDEVEYYRGLDLQRDAVAHAFGLPVDTRKSVPNFGASAFSLSGKDSGNSWSKFLPLGIAFFIILILIVWFSSCNFTRRAAAVTRTKAPSPVLRVGSAGRLEQVAYRVKSRALTEIAEVGRVFEQHEFELVDDQENQAWLIQGFHPGANDLILFTPLQPGQPLTPEQAAALKVGTTVNVDGIVAPVKQIFQSVVRLTEGAPTTLKQGDLTFGFTAQSGAVTLLVRWSKDRITFHQGRAKDLEAVKAAFDPGR